MQINHPEGLGTIGALQVDLLRGISLADPSNKRLPVLEPDAATGDTRLWSEDFTALEIFNSHDKDKFWTIMRWWLTMVGRGFSPAATAVTDTHRLYSDLGAVPRSYVWVGEDADTTQTFDRERFARAINEGRLIGTSGPFMQVSAMSAMGETAGLGDVLDTRGQPVQVSVHLEMPAWIEVDVLDIYINRTDVVMEPGEENGEPLVPDQSIPLAFDPSMHREVVSVGGDGTEHARWAMDVAFEVDAPRDAYVVVIARKVLSEGEEETRSRRGSMWPVVPWGEPFAYANPLYLDVDGSGWDDVPLGQMAMSAPAYDRVALQAPRAAMEFPTEEAARRAFVKRALGRAIKATACSHDH